MKIKYKIVILILSIFASSCGNHESKVIAEKEPVNAKINTVNENRNNAFLNASGTIQALKSANLSTRMMGFVTSTPVNVGDKVKKGDLLLAINNADLQAKLSQVKASINEATAAFTNAEKDYNRFKALFTENSASQKELDDITAHYNIAKARLEGAKQMKNEVDAQFAYANLRAPFDGVVTGRFIKNGDMTKPGMPLISIEAPDNFEVIAMVPESDISKILAGTNASILVKSMNKTLPGKVTEVSTSAQNTGGQYLVKITVDKTDTSILSGMFVTIQFPLETQQKNNMVLIPKSAIVTKGQLSGIYTVSEEHTAILRWLRLGRTFGDNVEVLSGLSPNESYIVSADSKLYNGVKLAIQ